MKLELATQNDFDAIIALYDDVTARTPEMDASRTHRERQTEVSKSNKIVILISNKSIKIRN